MDKIERNSTILFLGDSITEQGMYIKYLESYLGKYFQTLGLKIINFGKSSETASGLSEPDHPWPRPCIHERLDEVLDVSNPDITFICYGMNDGIYYPFAEERFGAYKQGMIKLINKVKSIGSKVVLITPPPFDKITMQRKNNNLLPEGLDKYSYMEPYEDYNNVLRKYSDWLLTLEYKVEAVVDVNDILFKYIQNMHSNDSTYLSGDGIHPGIKEHWVITRTLLKKLMNLTLERFPALDDCTLPEECKSQSEFKGYKRYDFYVNGREGVLICPENPVLENKWIWRTEFLGAFDQADMAMVEKGWHLAYYRISDMYGSPSAVELMRDFQSYLENEYNLYEKAVLFGFSRGGLYAFNYASQYPEKVAKLYLDAPVMDIRSWPGGLFGADRYHKEWQGCLDEYNLDEKSAKAYEVLSHAKINRLIKANIPILVVAGDVDAVVPYEENAKILVEKYKELGGRVEVIIKPGIGHHPHSLDDVLPIIEFVL